MAKKTHVALVALLLVPLAAVRAGEGGSKKISREKFEDILNVKIPEIKSGMTEAEVERARRTAEPAMRLHESMVDRVLRVDDERHVNLEVEVYRQRIDPDEDVEALKDKRYLYVTCWYQDGIRREEEIVSVVAHLEWGWKSSDELTFSWPKIRQGMSLETARDELIENDWWRKSRTEIGNHGSEMWGRDDERIVITYRSEKRPGSPLAQYHITGVTESR